MTVEIWKDIPTWEEIYQASTFGSIRSLYGLDARNRKRHGKVLKQSVNSNGYYQVRLSFGNRVVVSFPHQLVLTTFVSKCPVGMQACHWDDNKLNNVLSNLRWDTRANNRKDAVRNGRVNAGIQVIRSDGVVFSSIHRAANQTPNSSSGRISEITRGIRVGKGLSGGYGWSLI